jgi:DNA polymerase III delta subunit
VPTVSASTVRKQIAAAAPDPVYLLQGEDEVEKTALAHAFEDLIEEDLRAFNVERIYAGEWTTGEKLVAGVGALAAAVRTFPMMAPRRVVIVHQAEAMLAPKRDSEAAGRALDELERVLKSPQQDVTILLVGASLDRRSRIYKLLSRHATVVECGIVETQADAEQWIRNRVSAAGLQIEPAGVRLLATRCGTDVRRLRNDVDRLLLYVLGQKLITLEDARQIAGPAAIQDDWAMANAIEARDGSEALRQLALMLDAGAPPEKILGQLGWLVRTKLAMAAPSGVRRAIDAVFRTDQDLKRSAGDPRVLLERLVVELTTRKA